MEQQRLALLFSLYFFLRDGRVKFPGMFDMLDIMHVKRQKQTNKQTIQNLLIQSNSCRAGGETCEPGNTEAVATVCG